MIYPKYLVHLILVLAFHIPSSKSHAQNHKKEMKWESSYGFIEDQLQPDQALVYIIRRSRVGTAVKMSVFDNDTLIGHTYGRRFIYGVFPPGNHTILSKSENKSSLSLELEAGKIYYLLQKPKMGFLYARNRLEETSEEFGRSQLVVCKIGYIASGAKKIRKSVARKNRREAKRKKN